MKNLVLLVAFISFATISNAQSKFYGGLAFANNGPKAELGLTETFDEGGFKIKTSLSYTYELSQEETSNDLEETQESDVHHLSVSSVLLFEVKKFDVGGGFSYRFFLPTAAGSVGVELVSIYHLNEKFNVQAVYDRTISGSNFVSLGVNYNLF
jgi:hypothetical protein